jgi:hypothetical protein
MNGAVIRFSRSAASVSPCRSIGMAKAVRNFSADPSRPGLANSMIDHSSASLFSTGVPVSAILVSAGRLRTAWVWRAAGFLRFCASSHTTLRHRMLASWAASRAASA